MNLEHSMIARGGGLRRGSQLGVLESNLWSVSRWNLLSCPQLAVQLVDPIEILLIHSETFHSFLIHGFPLQVDAEGERPLGPERLATRSGCWHTVQVRDFEQESA